MGKSIVAAGVHYCACCRIVNFFNNDSYQTLPKSHILKTSYIAEKGKTSMPNMRSAQARETVRKINKYIFLKIISKKKLGFLQVIRQRIPSFLFWIV